MRIDGPQRPSGPNTTGRTRRADGTGATFELGSAPKPAETQRAAGPAAAPGLDALIALQMVEDPTSRRKRGLKRGRSILDALDEIKISLLAGRVAARDLARLLAAVEGRERDSEDPRLEALLDEIELRARVEMAKLDRVLRAS